MITLDNITDKLSRGTAISNSLIIDDHTFYNYMITDDVRIKLSTGSEIVIPKGFKHDKNSLIRVTGPLLILLSLILILDTTVTDVLCISLIVLQAILLFNANGRGETAAIIHDYMYSDEYRSDAISDRKLADDEFRIWLSVLLNKNIINTITIYMMYVGVRLFGRFVY